MSAVLSGLRQVETLIVLRHGQFGGNVQAGLTGKEATEIGEAHRGRD